MNFTDILGSVLSQGMSRSGSGRIDHSLGNSGLTGPGGIGDILSSLGGATGGAAGGAAGGAPMPGSTSASTSGGAPSGGMGGLGDILGSVLGAGSGGTGSSGGLGDILGSVLGGGSGTGSGAGGGNSSLITGGLGALAGALFGGGSGSVKGALGGSAMALLGSLALKVLRNRGGGAPAPSAALMAGLRAPENEAEERELQSIAELTVKAMFNAAKADGEIDRQELERIIGKLAEDGLTAEEREFVTAEANKPMDTDAIIQAAPNPQVAAQLYAASLLAIEVDTDAERQYLQTLATGLGLDHSAVRELHTALGVA